MKYIIVKAIGFPGQTNVEDILATDVQAMIDNGYQPFGSVSVIHYMENNQICIEAWQPMIYENVNG